MTTAYQSQYWAHALSLRGAEGSLERLSRSLAGARVDLNPHQVDAALFAVRSPFSKGVILADEVGLGKTIEAGIVLAQRWAERRRRILLILPATLRKQWQQELLEKFGLPSVILEGKSFAEMRRHGLPAPFEQPNQVVICSYHFAAARADQVQQVAWDLVVIDEAHRLRNVYRTSNRIARAIADAVRNAPKLLLTATPLQNSLMELYGLVSVIDEHVFGSEEAFREQFLRLGSSGLDEQTRNVRLKERLGSLCTRTLRKQVLEYIRFTQRVPITQDFLPSAAEQELYDRVSEYLQRDVLVALPASQRSLVTLILRKLLASSTFAIAGTLRRLTQRLEQLERQQASTTLPATAAYVLDEQDFDALGELEDEWEATAAEAAAPPPRTSLQAIQAEVAELRAYAELAANIGQNAKGEALVGALATAFERATALGAQRKAVIFTESRRTQSYLNNLLTAHGYANQIVLINGTNADPESRAIYQRWLERHQGSPLVSGSRSADLKAALVEEFRDRATLLVATESAAEGVNLQFCSLVVNFDLPWNPQRIEQRIGRCHRYGQQHDVVVVNFLNRSNAADERVFQLLSEKFRLFDGVFGASDEVLGAVESGVDLERRIAQVYQEARTTQEIQQAFDLLQAELDDQIQGRLSEARQSVLEHFDEEVHARLEIHREQALATLTDRQRWLMALTRYELDGSAEFDTLAPRFRYSGELAPAATYHFDWRAAEREEVVFYAQEHPLAQALIARAAAPHLPPARLQFDYAAHGAHVSALEPLLGCAGWMEVARLTVRSAATDEYLVLAGHTDAGEPLDDDVCRKLLGLPSRAHALDQAESPPDGRLADLREQRVQQLVADVAIRNAHLFDEESAKLDRWADDLKHGLEQELKEIDRQIREARRSALGAVALADKLEGQKQVRAWEGKRSQKRRQLYEAQDTIDQQRDGLIGQIERQLQQQQNVQPLFTARWALSPA